jgi:hypothetical protein
MRNDGGAGDQCASRSDLNAARSSAAKSSGCSQAAKCPPLSTSWKLSGNVLYQVESGGQDGISSKRRNPCDYPPPPYKLTVSTYIVSFLPLTGLHFILHFLPTYDFTLSWLAIWKT